MEIAIAAFIGLWLSGFALWGYIRLKKEYKKEGISLGKNAERTSSGASESGADRTSGKENVE